MFFVDENVILWVLVVSVNDILIVYKVYYLMLFLFLNFGWFLMIFYICFKNNLIVF